MGDYLSLGLSLISLALVLPKVFKQIHFVRRDSAVDSGVILIINGLVTFFTTVNSPSLLYWLAILTAFIGIVATISTSQRSDIGKVLGSGIVALILLLALVVVQFNQLGYVHLF